MRRHAFGALIALTLVAAVPPTARAQETPRLGGVLKVAAIGEPPTLDIQATTTVLTYEIMWHVYEPLFTHDRAWNPIPMLAESDAVSDRGLRHTITLRRGVKFHNGKELTAADVVASLKRWGQVATVGKVIWPGVESVEAKDPYRRTASAASVRRGSTRSCSFPSPTPPCARPAWRPASTTTRCS